RDFHVTGVQTCALPISRQVRRRVHGALRGWGLGPVAADLTDHLATLVHEFRTRTATTRVRCPIDLRLELRASARLLLGEIRNAAPPSDLGLRAPLHGLVALTYGRRPMRNGVRYIHSFAWWQPEPAIIEP